MKRFGFTLVIFATLACAIPAASTDARPARGSWRSRTHYSVRSGSGNYRGSSSTTRRAGGFRQPIFDYNNMVIGPRW